MAGTLFVAKKASGVLFRHAGKLVAVAASAGAALVTIFTTLFSYGVIGETESHQSIGNLGAAWVGLRPIADTATAIGDTIHYAATVTDKNGSILVGARPTWTTGDSTIAKVLPDGSVIARGPGRTMVSVVVGKLVAHSKIVVQQKVAVVDLTRPGGDTTFTLPEAGQLKLHLRAIDARGHAITGRQTIWHVDDSTVASVDTAGEVTGRNAGRTVVSARIDGVSGRSGVAVVTPAAAVGLVTGSSQRAVAGMPLPQAIVVRATSRRGAPVAGQIVAFRASDGQGKVDPVSVRTDADGRARATWTLGRYPGRQTLFASVENVDSSLAIVAEADPVPHDTRVAPLVELVKGKAGQALAEVIGIRVTDSSGRVLPDVPVRWTPTDGGVIEAQTARTDSLGVAHAKWTLGGKTGTQRVRIQVGGGPASLQIPPVTISAISEPGAPAAVLVEAGDNQTVKAGAKLPKTIVFRVVDATGSGVGDVEMDLSPSAGELADSSIRTDSLGRARIQWIMGRSAGAHSLAVRVKGVKKPLKLAAHAKPGAPANISLDDVLVKGKPTRSTDRLKRLYAVVTDIYGNPVPDARVRFSATSGTVVPARAVSDTKGRAELTWRVGSKPGEQVLSGAVLSTDVRTDYTFEVPGSPTAGKTASLRQKTK